MDNYHYFSQSDKATIQSLNKKNDFELAQARLEAQENEQRYIVRKPTPENNRKVRYYSNRVYLIDYVINQRGL